MLRLSYSPAAIHTTAAMISFVGAPFHAYAAPIAAVHPEPEQNADAGELSEPEAAIQLTPEHNRAIYAALVISQTEISGPIFAD